MSELSRVAERAVENLRGTRLTAEEAEVIFHRLTFTLSPEELQKFAHLAGGYLVHVLDRV